MRWPPITMATQHPDHASIPWWKSEAFITAPEEIDEMLTLFETLPIDEYMWDWEGKYVDEGVGEKLFSRAKASEFFSKHPLGEDLHLTYRIPTFDGQKMHRMARAFMNILSLADLAHDIGLERPPVTEMFLPLTRSAEQAMQVRRAFREVAYYHQSVFHHGEDGGLLSRFDVTPLVEDVDAMFDIDAIVRPYWQSLASEKSDLAQRGQRIFLARSDPALNAGIVPAVLAVKAALAVVNEVGASLEMPVYPILGTGSLPFRGNLDPRTLDVSLPQYAGVRTYSIQSAFRYDSPIDLVRASLEKMKAEAPQHRAVMMPLAERNALHAACEPFTAAWRATIEQLAPLVNTIAEHVPRRRERLQHIGLFGYSRGIGKVKLPRAIGFTAALYSIGIPPELVGTGRGLAVAKRTGTLERIEHSYPALRHDLTCAGKYLNRENLELLIREDPRAEVIREDVAAIESVLGMELGPKESDDLIHRNLTSTIYQRLKSNGAHELIERDIIEAGTIRRSLG